MKDPISSFRPIEACFERCDTIRAQHLLWEDMLKERTDLNHRENIRYKMAFYVLLGQNQWNATIGKDQNGYFGYGLRFIPRSN